MNALKHEERGLDAVCEVMEKYEQKAVCEANIKSIKYVIKKFGATKEQILENKDYSEEEYDAAIKELAEEGTVLS